MGSLADRIADHCAVSTALSLLSDRRLGELVAAAPVIGSGIGGVSALLKVEGVEVFVKRIRLTGLEARPENVLSTANLFELPPCSQYGIGGPAFGVWREVAANVMTTNWVLGRETESFPLMYHWRVLDGPEPTEPTAEELSEVDSTVEFWHGSPAIRRLEINATASASVVLFMECVPQHLEEWLAGRLAAGEQAVETAFAMVERELLGATSFINSRGLFHFDAHFQNILTDGERLYLTDFGLATSSRFELSDAEAEFLAANETHDGCYVVMRLVNWLVSNLSGVEPGPAARNAYIRRCAEGADPTGVPAWAAAIIRRHAPIAIVLNDFYWVLFGETRQAPYPVAKVAKACAATGFEPILSATR